MHANEKGPILTQDAKSELMAKMAESHSSLMAVFSSSNLSILNINKSGQRLLKMDPSDSEESFSFALTDILGVSDQETFKASILPMLLIMGHWTGRVELRDFFGSSFVTLVHLYRTSDYVCLQATRIDEHICENAPSSADSDFLAVLLNHSPDCIYFKDKESRILRASQSMVEKFGLDSLSDLIGKTDFDFFGVEHASRAFDDERSIVETGEPIIDKEEKETWASGSVSWATTSKMPLRDADGNIIGSFGISRDITSRKVSEEKRRELEIKLQLAHKLESIGSLAAGVAHEINTPIQFITDNVGFLRESFEDIDRVFAEYEKSKKSDSADSKFWTSIQAVENDVELDYLRKEIPDTIEQTIEGLARVARIVRSLKEFAHPGSDELSPADINAAIETTINVARHEWKYVADMETDFAPDLPEVPCVLDEFNQVVLNLIVNAAHAIEAANTVRNVERGNIAVRTSRDGDWAVVEVEDSGTGIPEEAQAHVFEPFFTTKSVGKGTGQGLAFVQNVVVKRHGGTVEFETCEEKGTTFCIRIPLTHPENVNKTEL